MTSKGTFTGSEAKDAVIAGCALNGIGCFMLAGFLLALFFTASSLATVSVAVVRGLWPWWYLSIPAGFGLVAAGLARGGRWALREGRREFEMASAVSRGAPRPDETEDSQLQE